MGYIMKNISKIWRCSVLYRSNELEYHGLNGYQHIYILRICQNPGITQEQLSKIIFVNKSTVTRQISLLEQNGFIKRNLDENDKRIMRVHPTQKSYDIYPLVKKILNDWESSITRTLTDGEKIFLDTILEKLAKNAMLTIEDIKEK